MGPDKKLTAEFYSIDQTSDPLPVDSISLDGRSVKVALPMIQGSYAGTLSADSNSIDGVWTQRGSNPLKFERPVPDKKDRSRVSAKAIMAGEQKYTEINCPALAIFADPHEMGGPPMDEKQKAAAAAHDAEFTEGQAKAWERMVPTAKVIRIPNANHYVFKSNEPEVLKDVEEWVDGLN
jgi:hypothetical protein